MRLADIRAAATGALQVIAEPNRPGQLRLLGELDMCTRGQLLAAAAGHIGAADLRLDASGLTFLDCSGLAALVRIADATRDTGAAFTITASSPALSRLSALANTDDALGLAAPPGTACRGDNHARSRASSATGTAAAAAAAWYS